MTFEGSRNTMDSRLTCIADPYWNFSSLIYEFVANLSSDGDAISSDDDSLVDVRVDKLQLQPRNFEPTSSEMETTVEFIRSLRGCRVEKFIFEDGVRLQPSSVVLHLERRGNFRAVDMVISILDRSGNHDVDGTEEILEEMVKLLQREARMGEHIEIEDIQVKELQESHDSHDHSESVRLMWKAFIQVKLKWRHHTAVIGDLSDDVGTGIQPEEMYYQSYFEQRIRKKARVGRSRSSKLFVAEDTFEY